LPLLDRLGCQWFVNYNWPNIEPLLVQLLKREVWLILQQLDLPMMISIIMVVIGLPQQMYAQWNVFKLFYRNINIFE